ncbi:LysE family translocator [Paenibacillus sp. CGMCC 1.16610]|uniref:LysE family transporter n=1 Tax=Paenibacillus anseongense TaxID=2682845 RepID=A0ABW9UEF0_9BACL|nr:MULTISPECIES: LysE family translocator [Paenibacillus]MBA2943662.1 LysE family translocator [Paenibacillus sp. CGMCC 1.16610]MVQ37568.1 LysE family transporter [Paenibacillus anseongense]
MISLTTLVAFGIVSLGMVCSPGPNMIYLISRSISQGRKAGIISLMGVALGFLVYLIASMVGLIAIFNTVPIIYTAMKWAGAAYLLWLAWKAMKPGSTSLFEPIALPIEKPRKLFLMGFITNLLNPKIAVLYISLLPQFQDPTQGSLLAQSATLGLTQIVISFAVNLLIVLTASKIAGWFGKRPTWLKAQRWLMSGVLAGLAVKLAIQRR